VESRAIGGCSPASTQRRRDSRPRQGCRLPPWCPPHRQPGPAAGVGTRGGIAPTPVIGWLVSYARSRWPRAPPSVHVCDGNSGRSIPASMCGAPGTAAVPPAARGTPPSSLWSPGSGSSSRPPGRRRAGTGQASYRRAAQLLPLPGRPAGRMCRWPFRLRRPPVSHPILSSPPPPTCPWRLRISNHREIFLFPPIHHQTDANTAAHLQLCVRYVRSSTLYMLAISTKLWLTPGHLGICAS
jgi:hypothetical protein